MQSVASQAITDNMYQIDEEDLYGQMPAKGSKHLLHL